MSTIVTRAGKGAALTWTEGDANITNLNNDKIENVVEDLTPQLGGDLDVNGKQIVSTANGNIAIVPDGTGNITLTPAAGKLVLGATDWPAGPGSAGQVLTTSGGTGVLSWTTPSSGGATTLNELTDVVITAAATNDVLVYNGTNWVDTPASNLGVYSASAIDIFSTDGSASDTTMYPVLVPSNLTGTQTPHIDSSGLSFNASTNTLSAAAFSGAGTFTTLSATTSVSLSTSGNVSMTPSGSITLSPSTVGSIDRMNIGATTAGTGRFTTLVLSAQSITSISTETNGHLYITPNGTGTTVIKNLEYQENVFAIGTTSGTITPNAVNGNIQTIILNGNLTINLFQQPISGQTITFIITQDATGGRTLTSTMKFAGGAKTLSTAAGSIDILTVSYIGTTYYASLVKGYV